MDKKLLEWVFDKNINNIDLLTPTEIIELISEYFEELQASNAKELEKILDDSTDENGDPFFKVNKGLDQGCECQRYIGVKDCSKCNPKIPKLGKRYKRDNQNYTCVELKLIDGDNYYFNMLRDGAGLSRQYGLEDSRFFEELNNNPKVVVKCKNCGTDFEARVADRKRGWAKFCSKSCKASKQVKSDNIKYHRYKFAKE